MWSKVKDDLKGCMGRSSQLTNSFFFFYKYSKIQCHDLITFPDVVKVDTKAIISLRLEVVCTPLTLTISSITYNIIQCYLTASVFTFFPLTRFSMHISIRKKTFILQMVDELYGDH